MDTNEREKLEQLRQSGILTETEYQEAVNKLNNPQPQNDVGYARGGMQTSYELPAELNGLNWGAFFLGWIWGIAHNTWLSLLVFIPYVGWIMSFVLLFKGNEWAWKNRKFSSIQDFKDTEKVWTNWGIGLFILSIVFAIFLAIAAFMSPAVMQILQKQTHI